MCQQLALIEREDRHSEYEALPAFRLSPCPEPWSAYRPVGDGGDRSSRSRSLKKRMAAPSAKARNPIGGHDLRLRGTTAGDRNLTDEQRVIVKRATARPVALSQRRKAAPRRSLVELPALG
jgi:hypothetical protein